MVPHATAAPPTALPTKIAPATTMGAILASGAVSEENETEFSMISFAGLIVCVAFGTSAF